MALNKIQVTITDEQKEKRLDKFLSEVSEIGTRSRAQYLIEQNLVFVNGRTEKNSYITRLNDQVEISYTTQEDASEVLQPLNIKLDIVFEDSDLIVVNKPAGLVVHPAAGHAQDTLVNALIHHTADLSMKFGENRPGIVHRIDRDTSGLLVVAKNDFTHEKLAQQFKDKSIHRIYYTVVKGEIKKSKGTLQSYLQRHPKDRKKYHSARNHLKKIITTPNLDIENSKWAVSHFQCLKKNKNYSYLEMKLETGRTHQIRVHLSEIGHAIYGDEIYNFKYKPNETKFSRFLLHAAELGFIHPKTNERIFFKIDWPKAEKEFIERLFL